MKHTKSFKIFTLISASTGLWQTSQAQVTVSPPNYTITTPSSEYEFVVNGQSSGKTAQDANVDNSYNFTVSAGATYQFTMNSASFHPVDICTNPTTSAHYTGASAQAVSAGTVTLTIPATNYPTTLYYICDFHTFYGIINVTAPHAAPATTVLKTAVSSNIVLTFSGGTNTMQLLPQYSSNLASGVWTTVPGYTNTFGTTSSNTFSGTNTTSFERLDQICGPDVFLRIKQVVP